MRTCLKILIAVIITTLIALSILPVYTAALEPHENPDKAAEVIDGAALLREYAWALEYVSVRDLAGLRSLINNTTLANIPPDLEQSVDDFFAANEELAQLLSTLDMDIDTASELLSQFRREEVQALLESMENDLQKANLSLALAKLKLQEADNWLQAESVITGNELNIAFDEVVSKLAQQNEELDSLAESIKNLAERSQSAQPYTTSVSLDVSPTVASVGDKVTFHGQVTSETKPLSSKNVTILLDGVTTANSQTDPDGNFQGELVLPYNYVPEMSVKALYSPEGDDVNIYSGSISPTVTLSVLFHLTNLNVEIPKSVYPGTTFELAGKLDYGDSPVPPSRMVQVYWDDELNIEQEVKESFIIDLPVPDNIAPGKHLVKLDLAPQQLYSPISFTAEVEVTRPEVFIDVDAQGMVLLPFGFTLTGKVYSDLGPLNDATVNIALGDWEVTTRTDNDGAFKARLNTGMSLTMFGSRNLKVTVEPEEPWNQTSQVSPELTVINLTSIACLALALAIILYLFYRIRRAFRGKTGVSLRTIPTTEVAGQRPVSESETREGPVSILTLLYRQVIRQVQKITSVMLRPNQTLREFTQETAPRLGPLKGYFREFTLIIERLLYSKHPLKNEDVAKGQELSKKMQEGTGE